MIRRSCRWTPLGPYTVQVPVAGGPSTFLAESPSDVSTDATDAVVAGRTGIWRRRERPLGPWSRATQFLTPAFGLNVALVDGQPITTAFNHGVTEIIVGDLPVPTPAGITLASSFSVGASPGEVLVHTVPGTFVSRDGGQSFDPLWPGRQIQSAAPVGGNQWVVSELGRVFLATGSTVDPAGVGVLPVPTATAALRTTVVSAPSDRSTVWAVFALVDQANLSLTLFAVFVSLDGGVGWTPVVAPRSLTVAPTNPVYLDVNSAAMAFERGLPAGVDPLDPERLLLGLDQVWDVRRGATERVLFAQALMPHALAVTGERVWAATSDGVRSIDRIVGSTSRWVERDRGRGAPEGTQGGTHHEGVASFVAASFTPGAAWSRAHPVWRSVDARVGDVAIRETLRQLLLSGFGGIDVADGFVPPLRPLHGGESMPQLARAPSDERIAWFGGRRLFRLEGDVVRPVVEFDRHNPTSDFMRSLSVSPTDPNRVFVQLADSIVRVDFAATGSTATPIPLPPGIQGFSVAIAAGVADGRAVYLAVAGPATPPTPRILRWDPSLGQWADLTAGVGDPGPGTRLTAVAVLAQPGGPDRIIVGGEGVWESRDLGVTWVSIGHGLPALFVQALAVHEGARRIRAFTDGRGVWERDLDVPPCPSTPPHVVELLLRSHDLDDGSRADVVDPFDGRTLTFEDATGLRVDARAAAQAGEPASFQRPIGEPEWGVDTVAFPQIENRAVTAGGRARIYIEAHNCGPDVASPVVWVAWAPLENGALPQVQPSFWLDFPGDTLFSGPWKVVGVRSIPALLPAVPEVVRITWDVPNDAPRDIGLIAVLHSTEDPVFEGINPGAMERDPTALARVNRRVLVRKVKVAPGPPPRVDPTEPSEPGQPPEESKLGYWIVGGVVLALIVVGTVWLASGGLRDDE